MRTLLRDRTAERGAGQASDAMVANPLDFSAIPYARKATALQCMRR
jgi:hypothetical protein